MTNHTIVASTCLTALICSNANERKIQVMSVIKKKSMDSNNSDGSSVKTAMCLLVTNDGTISKQIHELLGSIACYSPQSVGFGVTIFFCLTKCLLFPSCCLQPVVEDDRVCKDLWL